MEKNKLKLIPAEESDIDFIRFWIDTKIENKAIYQIFEDVMDSHYYSPRNADMYIGMDTDDKNIRYFSAKNYSKENDWNVEILFSLSRISLQESDNKKGRNIKIEVKYLDKNQVQVTYSNEISTLGAIDCNWIDATYENGMLIYSCIQDHVINSRINESRVEAVYIDNEKHQALQRTSNITICGLKCENNEKFIEYPRFPPVFYSDRKPHHLADINTLSYMIGKREYQNSLAKVKSKIFSKN